MHLMLIFPGEMTGVISLVIRALCMLVTLVLSLIL